MPDADKAIELAPEFPTAYGARALCRADAGDLDGALADANTAIELGRTDAFAFYVRGLVRAEGGEVLEATADLRDVGRSPRWTDTRAGRRRS